MINGILTTVRGNISMANGLVSLTDMWNLAGKDKLGNNPEDWAREHNVPVYGDRDELFADEHVALAYAWHVSPVMAGTLQSQLSPALSPFENYADEKLTATSDKSHDLFVSALNAAGIHCSRDYSKLTNLIYLHTLNTSANSLRNAYCQDARLSVRKVLDMPDLAKVMTVEINVSAVIHSENLQGYADVAHKIKQHGELVQLMYRSKTEH